MLLHLEAFQACQNTAIFTRYYATVSGSVGTTFTDEFGRTAIASSNLLLKTGSLLGSPSNTVVAGFGLQQTTTGALNTSPSAFPGVAFFVAGGEQLRIEAVDASETKPGGVYYKLRVMRGATELARTVERFDGSPLLNSKTYFEFKATIRTSTNGSFELKYHTLKSRATAMTATWSAATTGINTANQGSDGADRVQISFATGDAADLVSFSDFYFLDTSGSVNNDYLGVLYMEGIKPDGTGTTNQWVLAGGAASVEDALNEGAATQSTLEDDKRITSDTVGDITLATMGNLSSKFGTTAIVGVQTRLYGKMDTAGNRNVQFFYRKTTGSPVQVGTDIVNFASGTLVGFSDTQETDPNTSSPWVVADINGTQLGVKLDS